VANQGNAVANQGNAVANQGNAVANQGNAVANQGNAVANQGNAVANQGNAVANQGNAVANQGNAVANQTTQNIINANNAGEAVNNAVEEVEPVATNEVAATQAPAANAGTQNGAVVPAQAANASANAAPAQAANASANAVPSNPAKGEQPETPASSEVQTAEGGQNVNDHGTGLKEVALQAGTVNYQAEMAAAPADLYPTNALLYWVGYDFQMAQKKLIIRILTQGLPEFEFINEHNLSQQPELVVRLWQTSIRPKIRRDVDATEFRSPVAYVRMRENLEEEYVDVVMTFREAVEPRVLAKDGNIQFTFTIPDHYYASGTKDVKQKSVAEDLSKVEITPVMEEGSDQPTKKIAKAIYNPNPGEGTFKDAPADGGVPVNEMMPGGDPGTAPGAPSMNNQPEEATPVNNSSAVLWDGRDVETDGDQQLIALNLIPAQSFSIGAVGQMGQEDLGMPNAANAMSEQAVVPQNAAAGGDIVGADSTSGGPATYTGRAVRLQFNEAELNIVLQVISDASGYNFVFPENVGKTLITVQLNNVPWDEALKAIMETNGLAMVPVGQNVMRIDQVEKIEKSLDAKSRADVAKSRQVETKVLVMRLSHGVVNDILPQVNAMLKDAQGKDDRIKASKDDRTNSIVVEAPEHVLAKVKAILERMDIETPQVEIEARIVEVNRNMDNVVGISWGGVMQFDPGRGLGFGSLVFPNSMASQFSVDPGVKAMNSTGDMNIKFGSLNKFLDLDLFLKMEERRGLVNVLQTNKLIVLDRQKAKIEAGSSQFFRPAPGAGGIVIGGGQGAANGGGNQGDAALPSVEFALSLDVTPEITASGIVNMNLAIKSEVPGETTGETLAAKSKRELATKMSLKSGDTAVIGGIYDTKTTHAVTGVPYLMDIPLIGFLFRRTQTTEKQMEMLIMVTPRILGKSDVASEGPAASQIPVAAPSQQTNEENLGGNVENIGNNAVQASQAQSVQEVGAGNAQDVQQAVNNAENVLEQNGTEVAKGGNGQQNGATTIE
jgi:type IV pilus secretin PilQ/predicted competence protein